MIQNYAASDLPAPLKIALENMGFSLPTPIQAQAIPLALAGRDIMGSAQTGTGKTAAFCIPVIAQLLSHPDKTAFILAPTRELAMQIRQVVDELTRETKELRATSIIGGADMRKQKKNLQQKPRIIVATPGRLADHIRRKNVDPKLVGYVVLDEGDRMLDMGFEKQIDEILRQTPKERQTLLFSATLSERVQRLAQRYLKNPARVSVGPTSQPVAKIKHSIVPAAKAEKNDILLDQLNSRKGSVLIFVNTKWGTNKVAQYLQGYGHSVARIHGDRTQGQRNQALQGFRTGKYRILVATDVAARGLDVPHIAHVVNYDLPKDHSDYVHRIGRTARAGAEGEALCLVSNEERGLWNKISGLYKLQRLEPLAQSKSSSQRLSSRRALANGGPKRKTTSRTTSESQPGSNKKARPSGRFGLSSQQPRRAAKANSRTNSRPGGRTSSRAGSKSSSWSNSAHR